jgi:hypothetical protein
MDDSNPKKLRTVKRLEKMVVIDNEGGSSIESNLVTEQVPVRTPERHPIQLLEVEVKKGFFSKFTREQIINYTKKAFRVYFILLLVTYGGMIILRAAGILNKELK